jgi:hypothetical protein
MRVSWVASAIEGEAPNVGNGKSGSSLQRVVYTVPEFCYRNQISRPTYRDLRAEGRGPREMRLGLNKILISAKAEEDWQRMMEEPQPDVELKAVERAVKAGKAAVESERHVSRRRELEAREDRELKAAKLRATSPRRRTRSEQHQSQQVDIQTAMTRHRAVKCAD